MGQRRTCAVLAIVGVVACDSRRRQCDDLVRVADVYDHAKHSDLARAADDAVKGASAPKLVRSTALEPVARPR